LLKVAGQEMGRYLQGKMAASDVVQDTFLKAHKSLHRFYGTSEVELFAWLRRILLNNLANLKRHYRGQQRRRQQEISLEVLGPRKLRGNVKLPGQELMAREQAGALQAALERLPVSCRQIIELRQDHRLSFEEAAKLLGRSADAARMLYVRALERLKDALQ
jgi:RNA polymerase sigma-70 factor (ECF subfamily)